MQNLSRQSAPVAVAFDVVWRGSAGKEDARMSEISMDGCFIDSKVQARRLGDIVEFKVHPPEKQEPMLASGAAFTTSGAGPAESRSL
jgi:glycerol kinase